MTLPSSLTTLEREAFAWCSSLTNVIFNNCTVSVGTIAFTDCTSLANVDFGNAVVSIGIRTFQRCTALTNMVIPNSVAWIDQYGFIGCSNLTSVTIGNGVTNVGSAAFQNCVSLTNVVVGSGTSETVWLGNCRSITTLKVDPANPFYSSLDGVLYSKATNLLVLCPPSRTGSITIPSYVTGIGTFAFLGCAHLTEVFLAGGITNIGIMAFRECSGLGRIVIPDGIIAIGDWAFAGCLALTNVTIGAGVANIGNSAFRDCTNLRGVYMEGDAPSAGLAVFTNAYIATIYYMPGTLGWGATFAGRPAAPWHRANPMILSQGANFGVQSNLFRFRVS